jgi:RteC protein.
LKKAISIIDIAIKWLQVNEFKPVIKKKNQITAKLEWTANIVDFVELIIALLEAKAFNRGRISKTTVINSLCEFFNIEMSSFYVTYNNIKSRGNRTQFLDELKNLLELKIDNDDEKISNRNKRSKRH